MIDRSKLSNAFEFVVMASARAQQLMRGCVPRLEGVEKPARMAEREVAAGLVESLRAPADHADHVES